MKRKIKDKKVLWLTKEIIYSKKDSEGIPIGNYTSQIFANIYLNEVDQYIKNILKVKLYYRYMDDSIILVETKEEAKYILEKIEIFLNEKLKLNLNSKTNISLTKFKLLTKSADNTKTKFQNINLVYAYNELADKIYSVEYGRIVPG